MRTSVAGCGGLVELLLLSRLLSNVDHEGVLNGLMWFDAFIGSVDEHFRHEVQEVVVQFVVTVSIVQRLFE